MVETNEDVEKLVEEGLDRELVGLCVHAGHQMVRGTDPYEIYEKHASWVRYAHLSDHAHRDGSKGAFIGEGVLDQRRLMEPLLRAGFDSWVVLESRIEGVRMEDYAARASAYLKAQWPEVEWKRSG
jgi:sugar phosphate isomerase/epimerase